LVVEAQFNSRRFLAEHVSLSRAQLTSYKLLTNKAEHRTASPSLLPLQMTFMSLCCQSISLTSILARSDSLRPLSANKLVIALFLVLSWLKRCVYKCGNVFSGKNEPISKEGKFILYAFSGGVLACLEVLSLCFYGRSDYHGRVMHFFDTLGATDSHAGAQRTDQILCTVGDRSRAEENLL